MALWHETRAAQVGIRSAGLIVLALAWGAGATLYRHVHAHAVAQASMGELGLCALLVLSLVVGGGLLFIGPALWKQVEVPGRWSVDMPEPSRIEEPSKAERPQSPVVTDTIRKYM